MQHLAPSPVGPKRLHTEVARCRTIRRHLATGRCGLPPTGELQLNTAWQKIICALNEENPNLGSHTSNFTIHCHTQNTRDHEVLPDDAQKHGPVHLHLYNRSGNHFVPVVNT